MTQTLRRELKQKFLEVLESAYQDNPPTEDAQKYNAEQAEKLADAALTMRGIKTDNLDAEYRTSEWTHGDFHEFPEHQWEWARKMRDDLGFSLPPKPKKREKSNWSLWVMSFDDMIGAAGDVGIKAFDSLIADFKDHMQKKGGTWPFEVAGPQSLVNTIRSHAARLKASPNNSQPVRKANHL